MPEPLLELLNVSKYYTGAQSVVMGLNCVSLTLCRGEFVAVTGESGSGKSTLAHVLGGILPYESGELMFAGAPTSHYGVLDWERYRRDNVSFISQSYGILPGATVMSNVMSALILAGMDSAAAKKTAGDILRRVELWELRNRRAAKLSSGQKQRLSIARALAKPAPILIADEPTGNLDAENSKKVIDLLADAARDRLVILVTHEFDEAKDLATRRIVLQEGRVAADTPLRPAPEPGPAPAVPEGKRHSLAPYVARLQCLSRPVWTALMAVFFAITAFAVFAFLGVFISSIDDTPTKRYDGSAFKNGDPTRIVVLDPELGALTEEDYKTILSIPHVTAVEPWACVADVQYGYREGVDLRKEYEQVSESDPISGEVVSSRVMKRFYVLSTAPFMRTVPILPEGETFLTEGRLPENMFEVVCGDGQHKVGDTIKVYIMDRQVVNDKAGQSLAWVFRVTGLTDYGDGLFFHEDMGRFVRQASMTASYLEHDHGLLYAPNDPYSISPQDPAEEPDDNVTEVWEERPVAEPGHFIGSYNIFRGPLETVREKLAEDASLEEIYAMTGPFTFRSDDAEPDGAYRTYELLPTPYRDEEGVIQFLYTGSAVSRLTYVDYEAFDTLTWRTPDEAGVTISDYAYTDRVLKALDKLGYPAISVYRQGSVKPDPELVAERKQTMRVCVLALLVTAALQLVVLRAMFSAQTESFKVLGTIGLIGSTARRSMVLQFVFFTLVGELTGAVGIWLCYLRRAQKIVDMIKYLPPEYMSILVLAHMALCAIAAVWVVRSLSRQIFPLGSARYDIDLEEDREARE